MRKKHLIIFVILLAIGLQMPTAVCYGQELICTTVTPDPDPINKVSPYTDSPIAALVVLNIHVLRETNGTGGLSSANIDSLLSQINKDFNSHNIYFTVEDSTNLDNSAFYADLADSSAAIFDTDDSDNAVDLYLAPSVSQSSGLADDIPGTALLLSVVPGEEGALSHFLGHCFGLFDTDETEVGNGDRVSDTPFDPGLTGYVTEPCLIDSIPFYAVYEDSIAPDLYNVMCSGKIDCWEYFSVEQGSRMLAGMELAVTYPFFGDADSTYTEVTSQTLITAFGSGTLVNLAGNVACFDFSGDQLKDLIVKYYGGSGPIVTACLYSGDNSPNAVPEFVDGTNDAFPIGSKPTRGIAGIIAADYDNDGDLDCFAPNSWPANSSHFFENNNGVFDDVSDDVGLSSMSGKVNASWCDYDGDGFVDLFVMDSEYEGESVTTTTTGVHLYKNVKVGNTRQFVDVTSAVGLDSTLSGTLSTIWADFDLDHDVDLVLMQGGGPTYEGLYSKYYENLGNGTFADSTSNKIGDHEDRWQGSGMISAGDVDRDGDLDIVYDHQKEVGWYENDLNNSSGVGKGEGILTSNWFHRVPYSGTRWETRPCDMEVFDYNLDGYVDFLIASTYGKASNFMYYNQHIDNPDSSFVAGILAYKLTNPGQAFGSAAADFWNSPVSVDTS